MRALETYPGTPQHQALLCRIDTYYRDDPRVLAFTLFGSLARGNWDEYSDLDLDVVVRDNVIIDILPEVRSLCASLAIIGEQAVLVVPSRADAADVVLASLCEFSIRFHPLAATSPNIVESVQLVSGRISLEEIRTAGAANAQPGPSLEADPVDAFLRLAIATDREIHRHHFWQALGLLDGMRTLLIEMFARAHGGGRPFSVFQAEASPLLQARIAAALPQSTLASLQQALLRLLKIMESDHQQLGRVNGLSKEQQGILHQVRQRQAEQ